MPITRRGFLGRIAAVAAAASLVKENVTPDAVEAAVEAPNTALIEEGYERLSDPSYVAEWQKPKPYLISTTPLNEGVVPDGYVLSTDPLYSAPPPTYLGFDTIYPKVVVKFHDDPSAYDPLGQYGYIAWKIKIPSGDQYASYHYPYGDYMKISDMTSDTESLLDIYEYAFPLLREQMEKKMKIVAPNVTVGRVAVNLQVKPGYAERVVCF